MGDVIQAQAIFAKNADYVTTVKRCLNDAEIMIRSGQGVHIASAFLRTQMVDGPTEDIRQLAKHLLAQLQQRSEHTPETVA